MAEQKQTKFKTVKKMVYTANSADNAQTYFGINLITSSKVNNYNSKRLLTPIEAEKRRSQLMTGTHTGTSSIRKLKKPSRKLSLKPAPIIPTAPKSAAERPINFI